LAKLFSLQRLMYEAGASPQDIAMLMEMALGGGGGDLQLEAVVERVLRGELQRRLGPADVLNIIELAEAFQVGGGGGGQIVGFNASALKFSKD
jgi:hypothetical protein